jgi:hypothetical protein
MDGELLRLMSVNIKMIFLNSILLNDNSITVRTMIIYV